MEQNGLGGYNKEMSKRWKELDESKRGKYKLKYQRMQEGHEYKMKNDPEYFAAVLRSQVEKRRNPYNLFVKDQKDLENVMEQKSMTGFSKEMSKRWKELDESKREEYKLKSQRMQEVRMQGEKMTLKNPEYFEALLRSQMKVTQNRVYSLFIKDQEDSSAVRKQNDIRGFQKEMSKRWKELDESKKEEYKLKCKRMQEEYENSVLLAPTDRH